MPAAGIDKDNPPGSLKGIDGFIGQQIPGGLAGSSRAGDDQPEGLVGISGMMDLGIEQANLTPAATTMVSPFWFA